MQLVLFVVPQKRENFTREYISELKFHFSDMEGMLDFFETSQNYKHQRVSRRQNFDFLFKSACRPERFLKYYKLILLHLLVYRYIYFSFL